MSFVCALSNEQPTEPCVSPSSGAVFERRLIVKYLEAHGTDPISQEPLDVEQLIDVKVPAMVKPRPPTATSIPALLKMLQDEWDACMLNSFSLRSQLHTARQELSHALYKHDAACRVIARLQKEVTAAREALATLKPHGHAAAAPAGGGMELETKQAEIEKETGLTEEIVQKLNDKAAVLTTERKQRGKAVPEGLAPADSLRTLHQTACHVSLHSASAPGITTLDIPVTNDNLVVTGGNDKTAVVFDRAAEQIVRTFKGHTKPVTSVIFHPTEQLVVSASPDATVRVWNVGEESARRVLKVHDAAVTGISLHATGDYVLSVSADERWAFSDIHTGQLICRIADADASSQAMTCAQFHPDGLIFGTGCAGADSLVKIWDLKERANVANFPGHSGRVRAIAFSENGYYLATAADDATVKLWDLRKLKNIKTLVLGEGNPDYEINDVTFDHSGTYLAAAGTDTRVFLCKQWQELAVLKDTGGVATGVRFSANALNLLTGSLDRSLRVYGFSEQMQQ